VAPLSIGNGSAGSLAFEVFCQIKCGDQGNRAPNQVFFGHGATESLFGLAYGDTARSGMTYVFDMPAKSLGESVMYAAKAVLNSHSMGVLSTDFANVGFTGALDGKACVWRLDTFRCVGFLSHPTATAVQHVMALPGDQHLLTAAADGILRIWGAHPWFPRSERGNLPLVARCNPPDSLWVAAQVSTARIISIAVDAAAYAIVVVWLCETPQSEVPALAKRTATLEVVKYDLPRALRRRLVSTVALEVTRVVVDKLQGIKQLRLQLLHMLF